MNKKHLLFVFYVAMSALVFSVTSCSSDDSDESPSPKVENALVINMMKGTYESATNLGSLYINESNNFSFEKDYDNHAPMGEIVTIGKVKSLADVSSFPKTGYSRQSAVLKGYGYIAYYYDENAEWENRKKPIRLFVEDDITDKAGSILGYKISYETPFYGKNQEIKFQKDEVNFECNGGIDTLLFTDGEPMIIDCESSATWCYAYPIEYEKFLGRYDLPCTTGVEIRANASDTIDISTATINVKTKYGKEKNITVTRAAAKPRLKFYNGDIKDISLSNNSEHESIRLNTNIPLDRIEISNTASDWCEATLEMSSDYYGYQKYAILKLQPKINDTNKERSGTVTLKYGSESLTLNVKQPAAYITCSYSVDKPYTTSYYSDSDYLNFRSNLDKDDIEAKSSEIWLRDISIYKDYSDTYRLYFNKSRNTTDTDREGVISISDKTGKISYSIKVIQKHK